MSLMITHAAKLTGADIAITMQVEKDIPYAQLDELTLELDLYRPEKTQQGPLLVWVHGGAWRAGHRSSMPLSALVQEGMVIASVSYRLTTHARFPANVHDIKAAIRFLRANQKRLRIQADEIVIAGASAGGHLAALVGMTNRHPELEGQVGEYLDASSDVQGIISFYGASNLNTILSQSTPHGLGVRIPALQLLLGGQPDQQEALAHLASPVF
ncbi:MAG: alpha/beta hydrolase, partial [Verrucomicrobia bacterium]|nr:alpha/beta hydrolase [Verrucomicrobiota bacterium]